MTTDAAHRPNPASPWADALALAVIVAVAAIAALTFRDYGLATDDHSQHEYGEMLLEYYRSGFTDKRALSFANIYLYGGGFDMAAAWLSQTFGLDVFPIRRGIGAIIGVIGLVMTWRLARRLGGPVAGFAAVALLAATPLYYGHMFVNSKDSPFAVAMLGIIFALVAAFLSYPRPRFAVTLGLGVSLGFMLGTRVAGVVSVTYAAAALIVMLASEIPALGLARALKRAGILILRLLPALPIAFLIMAPLWPWSVQEPGNFFKSIFFFSNFPDYRWVQPFEGVLVPGAEMPARYVPTYALITLPEILLGLGVAGALGAAAAIPWPSTSRESRAALTVILAAVVIPIAFAMLRRPTLYDGIRHFIFVVMPFAVLAGLAAGWIWRRLAAAPLRAVAALVFAGALALPVVEMVRLHPYQYMAYNAASGGTAAKAGRFVMEYWATSFKEVSELFQDEMARRGEPQPLGRRWRVAICGPDKPAFVALDKTRFETNNNAWMADFVVALNTHFCRNLPYPVVAEVRREGVMFARVFDVRSAPTLCTVYEDNTECRWDTPEMPTGTLGK